MKRLSGVYVLLGLLWGCATALPPQEQSLERVGIDTISTRKSEYNFQISPDDETILFARAEADYSLGKIYFTKMLGGNLAGPRKIIFSDERYKDSDPWLSEDGRTLFFISDRPAYVGEQRDKDDYDIWRSRKTGDTWLDPEHLNAVASDTGEFGPEVHGEYLYFSSHRAGKYDVYRSHLKDGRFTKPKMLPSPINSDAADSDFTLNVDGNVALWWSSREGSYGSGDLYVSRMNANGRWMPAENLGPKVNSPNLDYTPSLSPNGAVLYYASNRPVAKQDEGAADIYQIAVMAVPALQEAMSQNALEHLKASFGGEVVLEQINSISYRLELRNSDGSTETVETFLDFRREGIMKSYKNKQNRTIYIKKENGISIQDGKHEPATAAERTAMLKELKLNFLYFLTNPDVNMIGPFDVRGHGNLQWFQLSLEGETTPYLGLDPKTGRIVKIKIDDDFFGLEYDYLETPDGLIWPHRFMGIDNGDMIVEGRYFNVRINPADPKNAPKWFRK